MSADLFSTPEHEMFRDTVRKFVEEEMAPRAREFDRMGRFDKSLYRRMGDLGMLGLRYDPRWGGAGLDWTFTAVMFEELVRCDNAGVVMGISVHTDMATPSLHEFGSDDLKERYRQGRVGDVEVKTSAGDIEMSWITGDVEAQTGNGRIDLAHVEGQLAVKSDWGSIEIRDVNGTVEAKGERGSIFASFAGEPAGVLETSRGTVRVVFPADAGVEIEAISRRGSVEIAPDLSVPGDQSGSRVSGPINGGGRSLRLYTGRGTVRVGPR